MDGLMIIILIVFGIWLGVLTLVVVLTIRQIALLTVRFSNTNPSLSEGRFSVTDDGLDVGSHIPEQVQSHLPELGRQLFFVLLLSANCTPCHTLVIELRRQRFADPVIALVAGQGELAADLAALLPPGIRPILDPVATEVAKGLHIQSTPFAIAIKDEIVVSKAYIYEVGDFLALVERSMAANTANMPLNIKEVDHAT